MRHNYIRVAIFTLLSLILSISSLHAMPEASSSSIGSSISSYTTKNYRNSVKAVYSANSNRALWTGERNRAKFAQLLDALGNPLFNYNYISFNQDKIIDLTFDIDSGAIPSSRMSSAVAKLDIMLTESYIQLIRFIRVGSTDWGLVKRKLKGLKAAQDVRATWEIHPKGMPSASSIASSIQKGKIKVYLTSMIPMIKEYRTLVKILEKYRAMPNFHKIPYGKILKPRRQDSRIRDIKKLLQFTGDFPRNASTGTGYGGDLGKAITSFKARFNLTRGNYIDNKTINYLNTTKEEYIRKILVNLEMLRLQPRAFESTQVEINIPEFKLRYYQKGTLEFSSNIIVGRIDRPTPIFSDKIKYMVLNPTWTITNNLVKRDLIPVLKKHPDYLRKHNIKAYSGGKSVTPNLKKLFKYEHKKGGVPYRFVQGPGKSNALGKVKFMFPNKYAVYLHDTDNKTLFKHRYRVYSSGCMRVEKPFKFMDELISNAGANISKPKIKSVFASNKPTTVLLKKPVPMHIVYRTVKRVAKKTYFMYDVYMYDQIVWESMSGHKKSTFRVPKKRLTKIERIGSRIR